jgi:hypothetical protein
MEGEAMTTIRLSLTFSVSGVDDLDAHTDAVLSALIDLETANPLLADSDLEAVLSKSLVTVAILSTAETVDMAEQNALAAIRTAIHTAGGATPEWDSVAQMATTTAEYSFKAKALVAA